MDEIFYRIYENLETDNDHIEFDLRAFRLREILSNKGISLRNFIEQGHIATPEEQ
jgi:hypothetical protein